MNARLIVTALFLSTFYLTEVYAADQQAPMEQEIWSLLINTVAYKHGKGWEKNFTKIYPNPTPTGLLKLAQLCDKFEECGADEHCNKPHMRVTVYWQGNMGLGMGTCYCSQRISDSKAIDILRSYVANKVKKH